MRAVTSNVGRWLYFGYGKFGKVLENENVRERSTEGVENLDDTSVGAYISGAHTKMPT